MFPCIPRAPRLFRLLASFALLWAVFACLPACKVLQEKPDNYLLEVAKSITKSNLQRLFPDARFERDSIQVGKVFEQAFLRKIFHEKVRHFLTPSGHIEASTQDFEARIAWERVETSLVRISLIYHRKKKQNLQGSRTLPTKRARDRLKCGRVSCTSC